VELNLKLLPVEDTVSPAHLLLNSSMPKPRSLLGGASNNGADLEGSVADTVSPENLPWNSSTMPTYLYITTRIVRSVGVVLLLVVLLLVVAVVVVVVTVVVFLEGAWRSDSEQEIRE
jgi:hypothetical protein